MDFSKISKQAGLTAIDSLTKSSDGQRQLMTMLETAVSGGRAIVYDRENGGVFYTHKGLAQYEGNGLLATENDFLPMDNNLKETFSLLLGSMVGGIVSGFITNQSFDDFRAYLRSQSDLDGFFLHIENQKSFLLVYRIGYQNSPTVYDRERLLGYIGGFFNGGFSDFLKSNGSSVIDQVTDKMSEQ